MGFRVVRKPDWELRSIWLSIPRTLEQTTWSTTLVQATNAKLNTSNKVCQSLPKFAKNCGIYEVIFNSGRIARFNTGGGSEYFRLSGPCNEQFQKQIHKSY